MPPNRAEWNGFLEVFTDLFMREKICILIRHVC